MTYANDNAELDALRKEYPLGTLEMETTQGRRWHRRVDLESEHYFNRYSREWSDNRGLLCDFKRMVDDFGTYVAIAYPVIANFVDDMYYRNPDPFIQDKKGDRDLGRIITDVIGSIHRESDSEREFKDAFQDQSWASFGAIGVSFEQKPWNAGQSITQPAEMEGGEPQDSGEIIEPTEQRVLIRRISPWRIRFDPKGRRWDLSDHRYIAFDTFEYLGPLMRDPLLGPEDRARLMAYYSQGGMAFTAESPEEGEASVTGQVETDPEFIRVAMRTIWSRPEHAIYRKPYGASFTFTPQPWDEEWQRNDAFPVHYMPRQRIPEDKKNTEGFIGMADLALIRPHVVNINKAQGLLVHELSKVLDVYVTAKGALQQMEMGNLQDGARLFKILQVDLQGTAKFPTQQDDKFKWDDVIHLLPTGDTKDLQHMAFMDHEFALIQQIIGQGPADRGGVADSDTATQSLGQQQGLARRMSANRNDAGKHYNAVTKKTFIVLQARQTLPIRYQMTTAFNQKVWATLRDPQGTLKDLDLHFEYATGSTEPRTRDEEFAVRERFAQLVIPLLQAQSNWPMAMKVVESLAEPLHLIGYERFFDDQVPALIMQLLAIYYALALPPGHQNSITADNQAVIQQIPELVTALAKAILTPAQFAEVVQSVQGVDAPQDGNAGGSNGMGSLPTAPSPGEASAEAATRGSAAAGMLGGIASQN